MVFLENSKNSPSLYHMLIVSALRRGYVRTLTQGSPMGHLWVTFFIGYKALTSSWQKTTPSPKPMNWNILSHSLIFCIIFQVS